MEKTNIADNIMDRAHQEGIQLAIKTMAMQVPYCPLVQVANVVLSLCSDGMHVTNGAVVAVDNGWTAF
jgi:hypothetical protein